MEAVEATPITIFINVRSTIQTYGVKSTKTKSTAEEEVVVGTTCLTHGADIVAAGILNFFHVFVILLFFLGTQWRRHFFPLHWGSILYCRTATGMLCYVGPNLINILLLLLLLFFYSPNNPNIARTVARVRVVSVAFQCRTPV